MIATCEQLENRDKNDQEEVGELQNAICDPSKVGYFKALKVPLGYI